MATETRGGSEGHVGTQHLPAHRSVGGNRQQPKMQGPPGVQLRVARHTGPEQGGERGPKAEDMWDEQWGKKTAPAGPGQSCAHGMRWPPAPGFLCGWEPSRAECLDLI